VEEIDAYVKLHISHIDVNKVLKNGSQAKLVLGNVAIRKVRLYGRVLEIRRFRKFSDVLIDDGSGNITCRIWEGTRMPELKEGDLVDVFGQIRLYNENLYVKTDIIRKINEEFVKLREAEIKLTELILFKR